MSNCGEFVSCRANVADSAIRPPKVPDSISEQLLRRNLKLFQGGLVFKARRLSHDSTLGSKVMKKEEEEVADSASIIYIYIYIHIFIYVYRVLPSTSQTRLFAILSIYLLHLRLVWCHLGIKPMPNKAQKGKWSLHSCVPRIIHSRGQEGGPDSPVKLSFFPQEFQELLPSKEGATWKK